MKYLMGKLMTEIPNFIQTKCTSHVYCKRANIRGGFNFAMFTVDDFSAKLKPPRSFYNTSFYSYLLLYVHLKIQNPWNYGDGIWIGNASSNKLLSDSRELPFNNCSEIYHPYNGTALTRRVTSELTDAIAFCRYEIYIHVVTCAVTSIGYKRIVFLPNF